MYVYGGGGGGGDRLAWAQHMKGRAGFSSLAAFYFPLKKVPVDCWIDSMFSSPKFTQLGIQTGNLLHHNQNALTTLPWCLSVSVSGLTNHSVDIWMLLFLQAAEK